MIGTTLAHYRIVEPLGKGGMGEVFVAEDTKLHRRVALKVLPADVALDPERRQRFEREAQAIAALNHPHIVTIHSVEESGGTHFLTMELVEGQTLAEIIPRHGLPLDRILKIAIPLADAVAAAHQKGITHRDLKPANIMVTPDGRVKVLDFGLAKLKEEQPAAGALASMATGNITGEGKILGTVAYMSPEQAEGKTVDHRSDIFALGVVLYEMATGERPFKGDTSVSIISSIIKDTPRPVMELNPMVPRDLARIVRHSLAKDPTRRYQTAADLRNELEELKQDLDSGELQAKPAAAQRRTPRWAIVAGIAAAALLTTTVVYLIGWRPRERTRLDFTVAPLTDYPGLEQFPSLSPDGRWIVFSGGPAANTDIFLQSVGGRTPINLTKDSAGEDSQPAFSPDGDSIAFRSSREGGGLFVMGRTGESARRLTDAGFNPTWSADGTEIAYATESVTFDPRNRTTASQLWIVKVATGERRRLDLSDAVQPSWSPHGHRIAYWAIPPGAGNRDVWTVPAGGGDPVRVTDTPAVEWNPVWAPDGQYLYFVSDRSGAMGLWRVAIDERTGATRGAPEPLVTPSEQTMHVSFSADGRRAAYTALAITGHIYQVPFDPARAEPTGPPAAMTVGSTVAQWFDVSADGEWLAFTTGFAQEDLFVIRTDGSGARQLTKDEALDRAPRWSPDGRRIAFFSSRSGKYEAWVVNRDGGGLQQLTSTPEETLFPVWSPDGSRITTAALRHRKAHVTDLSGPLPTQRRSELRGPDEGGFVPWSWSPDGRFVAGYRPGAGRGILMYTMATGTFDQIADNGTSPVFTPDGQHLVFNDSALSALRIANIRTKAVRGIKLDTGTSRARQPRLSSDGRRLFFIRRSDEANLWLLTFK